MIYRKTFSVMILFIQFYHLMCIILDIIHKIIMNIDILEFR
jgi:hypothetical protein